MKNIVKVAVVEWSKKDISTFTQAESLIRQMEYYIIKASECEAFIIVFPAFTGCLFQLLGASSTVTSTSDINIDYIEEDYFLSQIKNISNKYNILICPGSYWSIEKTHEFESVNGNSNLETEDSGNKKIPPRIYHESCIISNGNIILNQRQIYLARWERQLELSRGLDMKLVNVNGWNIGIILSTDALYPQVSRRLSLMGVDIVLSPVGFLGEKNIALQISGMWQETQQNLFFALESGFNGHLEDIKLWGESIVHAPLEMTECDNGILARTNGKTSFIISELDYDMRKSAISRFDVLSGLNFELYNNAGLFGGKL